MVPAATRRPDDVLSRARTRTLFVLWTTYGSFYLCRANLGPVRTVLQHDLAITAVEIGFVLGAVKLGYALGQLVNGQLTERFGPRRVLAIGMLGSACATLLVVATPALAEAPIVGPAAAGFASVLGGVGLNVSASPVLGVLLALAFLNGWFQAGGWPPCVKIASRWFPVKRRGFTMGVLGTSLTLGSAIAITVTGALLGVFGGWRVAFVVPAALLLASFVHTSLRLRERPPQEDEEQAGAKRSPDRMPIAEALRATLGNPRIWVLALGLFGVDAVRYGFLDWAPGHLAEVQSSGVSVSAMKTAVLPLAGAVGALSSGWITDRFFGSRRAPVCALLLGGVGALTLAYRVAVTVGPAPTIVCLGLVGFCLYGAQILLVGTAAQDFAHKGATAAAAGFVDFMGHVGASCGDVVTGLTRQRYGWDGAIGWWAVAAFAAAAIVATLWRARAPDSEELPAPPK
jgi:OPA family glycerol-3-phosphate transporter-like MFS transporter